MRQNAHREHVMDNVDNEMNTHGDEGDHDNNKIKLAKEISEPAEASREYSIDCIVREIGKGRNVKFVARWYGYTYAEETVKPPNQNSEDFITCFGHYGMTKRKCKNDVDEHQPTEDGSYRSTRHTDDSNEDDTI